MRTKTVAPASGPATSLHGEKVSGIQPLSATPQSLAGLAIKGGAPARKLGLIRSPLAVARPSGDDKPLSGADQRKAQRDAKSPAPETLDTKPYAFDVGDKNQLSRIDGIDDPHDIEKTMATQLSFVSFDHPTVGGSTLGKGILSVLAAGTIVFLGIFPDYRKQVFDEIARGKRNLIGLVRHQPESERRRISEVEVDDDTTTEHTHMRTPPRVVESTTVKRPDNSQLHDCTGLAQSAGAGTIQTLERFTLADCYLVHDDPLNVENALRPLSLGSRVSSLPANGHSAMADGFLTLMAALLKEGKSRTAMQLVGSACLHWEPSIACIGKAMIMADRRNGDGGEAGLRLILSGRGVTGKAEAYLMLAGAELARDNGNGRLADLRYNAALASTTASSLAIRKQIFESQGIDLLQRDDMARLRKHTTTALADLHALDAASLTKLRLLQEMTTLGNKQRALHGILTREDATFRLRGDFEMVEAFGLQALRYNLESDYTHLLSQTREHYLNRYQALDAVARRLSIWEIRATLARGEYDQAQQELSTYARLYGDDAYSRHLRGVTFSNSSESPRYQILAAVEFQDALRLHRDWESLYALGISLIRGGKGNKVAPLIRDLTKIISTPGQRYWLDMLSAEWYIEQGNYMNAKKILTNWRQAQGARVTPLKLLLQLYQKTGKTAAAQTIQGDLERLSAHQRFNSTAEGLASPLGAMALGRRPID